MSEENKVNNDSSWDFDSEKNKKSKPAQAYTKADYDIFIKLKPQEKPFRIRLASNPINFRSHWGAFKSISKGPIRSPAYSIDEKELDIAWAEGDWFPQRRHSALVFDRDDGSKLKILEAADSVFSHFGNWFKATKMNPSSDGATDWFIWVKSNGQTTEYSATPDVKPSPFTEEEKKIMDSPPFDINKVVKLKTPEQIMEMWMQLPDDKKYNPKSKFKAGKTFNKSEFEKRYGKAEEKPVGVPQISEQEAAASISQKEVNKPTEASIPKDPVPPVKDPIAEDKDENDDLPF